MFRLLIVTIAAGFSGGAALAVAVLGEQLADTVVYLLAALSLAVLVIAILVLTGQSRVTKPVPSRAERTKSKAEVEAKDSSPPDIRTHDERLALRSSRNVVRDLGEKVAPVGRDRTLAQTFILKKEDERRPK